MDNIKLLEEYAKEYGYSISEAQLKMFSDYYDLVIENNKHFNLTAILEEKDFINKHYIDSILGINSMPTNGSLLDIGSGAGFPAIPIAILRNDLKVTCLDSTAKKMAFVNESAKKIGLENVSTISGRAEELSELKNSFDIITARAVSSLQILLELALPLLKVNGLFIAYKTDETELTASRNALNILKASHIKSNLFKLPNGEQRAIIVIQKMQPTPSTYPRQYGTIKNKPL